jgi:hypothetical protein
MYAYHAMRKGVTRMVLELCNLYFLCGRVKQLRQAKIKNSLRGHPA